MEVIHPAVLATIKEFENPKLDVNQGYIKLIVIGAYIDFDKGVVDYLLRVFANPKYRYYRAAALGGLQLALAERENFLKFTPKVIDLLQQIPIDDEELYCLARAIFRPHMCAAEVQNLFAKNLSLRASA